jgi:hypothetical protein
MLRKVFDPALLPKGGRAVLFIALAAILYLLSAGRGAAQMVPGPPPLDPAEEAALIRKASTLDSDPKDMEDLRAVCTRCHTSTQFLGTPRAWIRWEEVFERMAGKYGVAPTESQIDGIVSYLQKNLTIININTSPAEEIGPTLQISDAAAEAIVAKRRQNRIRNVGELVTVPGVNKVVAEKLNAKKQLQF